MNKEENMRGEPAGAADLDTPAEADARRMLAVAFETVPARPGLAGDLIAAAGQQGAAATAVDVAALVRARAARARRRRVLVPAGAAALAAAVAGGVTAVVITHGGGASPTALQAVTAAFVKTSAESFTFGESDSVSGSSGILLHVGGRNGEFNPVDGNGEQEISRVGGPVVQYRFIGKYTYVRNGDLQDGKPWVRWSNGGGSTSPAGIAQGDGGNPTVNPADLFTALEGVSAVRYGGPVSGTGWTGTSYSFTVNPTKEFPAPQVSGTVSVDSSGRVRKLVTTTPLGPNRGHMTTLTVTMTFGGFGITVPVTPPPPSEVHIGG